MIFEEIRICLLPQFHQPGTISKHPLQRARKSDREPCLAHATDPGECQQTGRLEQSPGVGQLTPTTDETRQLQGQVADNSLVGF
jgi:hypothetical protein